MKNSFILLSLLCIAAFSVAQPASYDTIPVFETDTAMLCQTDSVYLTAGEEFTSYLWNTGDTTSGIWIAETATYIVTTEQLPGEFYYDTTYVNIISARILQNDTLICYGDTVFLSVKQKHSPCLIANYPFNGNADDYSGNGYDAFPFGATLTNDRYDNPLSAYDLDGGNQYLIATLGEMTGSFAVSMWFKVPDTSGWNSRNAHPTLLDYGDGQILIRLLGMQDHYIQNDEVGKIEFIHFEGAGAPGNFSFKTDVKPAFTEWHHIYTAFNAVTHSHQIWIDGSKAAEFPYTASLDPLTNLLYLGRSNTIQKDSSFMTGQLDDISIYDCVFDSVQISAVYRTGSIYNYKYMWSTGDSSLSIAKASKTTKTYYITVTDSINFCTDSVLVRVNPQINLELEQIDIGCPGEEKAKMLAKVDGGTAPYAIDWDPLIIFLQGDTLALGLKDSINYSITITDSIGCMLEEEFQVEAKPLPDIDFSWEPEDVYIQNPVVTFLSASDSANLWFWDFGDGGESSDENPVHTFASVDTYEVMLKVTAFNGCIDSLFKQIDINEVELGIPTVFTPNGDGVNDTFVILELDKYITNTLVVFNRYGKKVFEKNNYISGDWDGDRHSDGAYYYVLKCTGYYSIDEFKGVVYIITGIER